MRYPQLTKPSQRSSSGTIPYNAEDLMINTIIYDEVYIPVKEDLETFSKAHLKEQSDCSTLDSHGDCYYFGNTRGHTLMEKIDVMERNLEKLLHRTDRLTSELQLRRQQHESELELQKAKIRQHGSEMVSKAARRFLETYERDMEGNHSLKGSSAVRLGNARAHEGDALADACLLEEDDDPNTSLYMELYGLHHAKIMELHNSATDDGGIYHTINRHATLLAQGRVLSDETHQAFKSFISEAERSWLVAPNGDRRTPLSRAYCDFWRTLGTHGR